MALLVEHVYGDVAADGIQILTGRHVGFEALESPALAEDGRGTLSPSLLDSLLYFLQKLFRIVLQVEHCTNAFEGIA